MLTSAYPRFPADSEVPWLRETVNRLQRNGLEIIMVAPAWRGLKSHEIDGVEVMRFRYAPQQWEILTQDEGATNKIRVQPWLKLLAIPYVWAATWMMVKVCWQRDITAIHAHWPFPHAIPAGVVAFIFRKPLILTFHGAELALARRSALIRFVLRLCILRASAITANSSHTRHEITQLRHCNVQILPYGAPFPDTQPLPKATDNAAPFKILFVGRHVERKGVSVLISAVEKLSNAFPWQLHIIGDGNQTGIWKGQAQLSPFSDRIFFHGKVSTEALIAAYQSADVFVLPAIIDSNGDTEGLGVVLVEAISFGIPVVASRVGGIPDVIIDGETGHLVPPGDADALAEALRKVRQNPDNEAQIVVQAKRHAAALFSWEMIIDDWQKLYQNLNMQNQLRE